jgi:hypothetical protein
MENKKIKSKQQLEKFKGPDFQPWRILASIALFTGGIFLLPYASQHFENPINYYVFFFLFFQALAMVIDVVQGRIPLKPPVMFMVFLRYVFGTFLQLLALALCVPLIAILFFLGPVMFLLFFLALVGVLVFVIEEILRIDIKGVHSFLNWYQALIASGVIYLTGLSLFKREWIEKFFDLWLDKVTDLIVFLETGKKKRPPAPPESETVDNLG